MDNFKWLAIHLQLCVTVAWRLYCIKLVNDIMHILFGSVKCAEELLKNDCPMQLRRCAG